jgi:zinc and cadmium transporter
MSLIALVGSVTLLLSAQTLDMLLLPLVAMAAGSLIGGALFHMIPASLAVIADDRQVWRSPQAISFISRRPISSRR